MSKKKLILPIILVAILTLTACTTDDKAVEPDTTPVEDEVIEDETIDEGVVEEDMPEESPMEEETPVVDTAKQGEYADIYIKPVEAFDIYMEKYPETQVKEVQLDKDMGKYVYKIEGFDNEKEYELKIDPFNGDILKEDVDTDLLDDDDRLEIITRENVEKVAALVDDAIAESGENVRVEEWTLEEDDGIVKLEVEIERDGLDDIEYTYNIETGELLEIDD